MAALCHGIVLVLVHFTERSQWAVKINALVNIFLTALTYFNEQLTHRLLYFLEVICAAV